MPDDFDDDDGGENFYRSFCEGLNQEISGLPFIKERSVTIVNLKPFHRTKVYRYIPKVYQNMMTRLSPGEYITSNPALRSIVNIKFSRPTYKQFPNR
jgi:hypothetical protein